MKRIDETTLLSNSIGTIELQIFHLMRQRNAPIRSNLNRTYHHVYRKADPKFRIGQYMKAFLVRDTIVIAYADREIHGEHNEETKLMLNKQIRKDEDFFRLRFSSLT